eukprot:TRINITY_DN5406_c0_g1_i2.p1 TRINITY_DN5406_c0_g1~~TRINITY_DN5406_c0_g1_i2.p1  ORF type:complete len:268 (+),score=80.39 TRINITY_DN5406_c0_g1_i2:101-805(+)
MRLAYAKLQEQQAAEVALRAQTEPAAPAPESPAEARPTPREHRRQLRLLSEQLEGSRMAHEDAVRSLEDRDQRREAEFAALLLRQQEGYEDRLARLQRELAMAHTLVALKSQEVAMLKVVEELKATPSEDTGVQVDFACERMSPGDDLSLGPSHERSGSRYTSTCGDSCATELTLKVRPQGPGRSQGVDPNPRHHSAAPPSTAASTASHRRRLRSPALSSTSLFGPLSLFDLSP